MSAVAPRRLCKLAPTCDISSTGVKPRPFYACSITHVNFKTSATTFFEMHERERKGTLPAR